ncbi:cupin domain-containing protein [Muriicola sp.]|uniref:cupin domain-containing protein n=1 Tax=Muriicola sp. TaxID=2020856 RepID=UPI003566A0E3
MELIPVIFPTEKEGYLKDLVYKTKDQVGVRCGTVVLKKGDRLPFKTLDYNEIAYLLSGKLSVYTKDGQKAEMNAGDMIYLDKEEIRETDTLEDSRILFFLFKQGNTKED